MVTSLLVLDTYAFVAYFTGESKAKRVADLLKQAEDKKVGLMISLINWGEVFYTLSRYKGQQAAQEILLVIEQLPIEMMDVNRELVYEAAQLKAKYPLSYADCFAAALARQKQCPLLTGDPEFKRLEEEIKVVWL